LKRRRLRQFKNRRRYAALPTRSSSMNYPEIAES
jgi:hypothetical protein